MNKLTDLEIRKEISIILLNEQFPKAKSIEFDDRQNCFWVESIGFTSWPLLNPLLDDALLNQLIFKYEISTSFNFCLISMITDKQYEMNFTDIPSLKRKCLLLIIEAHKEL
tara:strand:+ start:346 stop:678 length:333 start_codon:yes stop_codon:yes gene_type:complete